MKTPASACPGNPSVPGADVPAGETCPVPPNAGGGDPSQGEIPSNADKLAPCEDSGDDEYEPL